MVNGGICFADGRRYAGSFGFQWHERSRTQLNTNESNRSERVFHRGTGSRPKDLVRKLSANGDEAEVSQCAE